MTGTVQYDLWKKVISRVEFRWDVAGDGSEPFGAESADKPGGKDDSLILLLNLAYRF